jgi:hypothetical protein
MNETSQIDHGSLVPAENRCAATRPAWWDRARCTADPATQAGGYRAGVGGEHRSTPVPLDLNCAMWLPARAGEAWLTQAVAPWPCSSYLRVRVVDAEVSMPVDYAAPQLSALLMLAMAGQAGEEV